MAYSMDLRIKVLEACDAGKGTKQVAEAFGVAASWVRRLKQRRREDGTIAPRPCGGSEPSLGSEHHALIHAHFASHPDTTVAELRDTLGLEVSEVTA